MVRGYLGAFLLASWPITLPKYGIMPSKIVEDVGLAEPEARGVDSAKAYGSRHQSGTRIGMRD